MGIVWRMALRRGLFGGSRVWMIVFAGIATARVFRRLSGAEPDVVYSEDLAPGQALVITHHADQRLGDDLR